MKITKTQLIKIVKEELKEVLSESPTGEDPHMREAHGARRTGRK